MHTLAGMQRGGKRLKNLAAKLIEVRKVIGTLNKDGRNDFHKYNYATAANVVENVKPELDKRGIMAFVSCPERAKDGSLTTVKMEFLIVDTESGESVTLPWYGDGEDKLDKGLYKAYTGGQKYFWLANLLIATDDDPENPNKESRDKKPSRPVTSKPANQSGYNLDNIKSLDDLDIDRLMKEESKCAKCSKEVPPEVIRWCESHPDKYGGKVYCKECQKQVK